MRSEAGEYRNAWMRETRLRGIARAEVGLCCCEGEGGRQFYEDAIGRPLVRADEGQVWSREVLRNAQVQAGVGTPIRTLVEVRWLAGNAWRLPTCEAAWAELRRLHQELKRVAEDAARSLAEGLEETLTLHRLGGQRLWASA